MAVRGCAGRPDQPSKQAILCVSPGGSTESRRCCTGPNPSEGRSVLPETSSDTGNAMTTAASMRLLRQGGGSSNTHNGRAWQVVVDGSVVGSLPNNETVDLPVEAGHHSVQVASMRFLRSPKASLEVTQGQVVRLSCRKRARHPFIIQRSIYFLVASLFKHDVWISLTSDDTIDTELEADGNGLRTEPAAASMSAASAGLSPTSRRSPVHRPSTPKPARPLSPSVI